MCCPNRSWGSLIANLDYEPKGKVVQLDDLPIYVVGKSEKCLLWNYHIFGFNDGRGKQLCDMFADQGNRFTLSKDDKGFIARISQTTRWYNLNLWEHFLVPLVSLY